MRTQKEQELRDAFRKLSSYLVELGDGDFGASVDDIARELFSVPGPGNKRVATLRSILRGILAAHNGGTNEYSFDRSLPDGPQKNREYHHAQGSGHAQTEP
ncbi:hypothetical protein ACT3UD_18130, partial [Glutamicibacter sp. 287]|uniref:hypothetical protein n=3 Tax=unclassified Glutamicibacter TaxID=2627139 RepID=UPI0040343F02